MATLIPKVCSCHKSEKTARVVVHIQQLAFENIANARFHFSFTTLNILHMNIFQTKYYISSALILQPLIKKSNCSKFKINEVR
jgi:hypothetical protein